MMNRRLYIAIASALGLGCGDDLTPGGIDGSTGHGTTQDGTSTGGPQPDSSDSSESGASESSIPGGSESGSESSGGSECGDGIVDAGEQCDEGEGNGPGGACSVQCEDNVCGDGDVGPAEACDDGNTLGGDGCDASCVLESCGNRVIDRGETCDDGNDDDDDECTSLCRAPECGDGVLSPSQGEECDDGNMQSLDACPADCTEAVCGDGDIEGEEGCDDGESNGDGVSQCTAACEVNACGDGYLFGAEQCEPGQPTEAECSDFFLDAIGTPSCTPMCFYDDSACAQACHPLLQDCAGPAGGCIPGADAFYCFVPGSGADGDTCASHHECDLGLLCVDASELDGCAGTSCCTNFCDVGLGTCSGSESCEAYFLPGEAPPELADVGYCRVP